MSAMLYLMPPEDGFFTYFFRTQLPTKPTVFEDGSVDYKKMDLFEEVRIKQKIAEYTPATKGIFGYTVTGKLLPPLAGKNLSTLKGTGFIITEDKKEYIATINGKIELNGNRLKLSSLYTVHGDANVGIGNITFDGDVCVKGNVISNIKIEATGNIEVQGNVEAATLIAGKDVVIKQGMQGGERGLIEAGGSIAGKFFESAYLVSKGDINANYMLNCDVKTNSKVIVSGNKGVIVGGKVRAALGISAFEIGNRAEAHTIVNTGISDDSISKYDEIRKKILTVSEDLEVLRLNLAKIENKFTKEDGTIEHPLYSKIKMAFTMKQGDLNRYNEEKNKICAEISALRDSYIIAKGGVNPGNVVVIDTQAYNVPERVSNVKFKQEYGKISMFDLA